MIVWTQEMIEKSSKLMALTAFYRKTVEEYKETSSKDPLRCKILNDRMRIIRKKIAEELEKGPKLPIHDNLG